MLQAVAVSGSSCNRLPCWPTLQVRRHFHGIRWTFWCPTKSKHGRTSMVVLVYPLTLSPPRSHAIWPYPPSWSLSALRDVSPITGAQLAGIRLRRPRLLTPPVLATPSRPLSPRISPQAHPSRMPSMLHSRPPSGPLATPAAPSLCPCQVEARRSC